MGKDMKVYIMRLCSAIDRDPKYGVNGGSSQVLSKQEQEAHIEAHRFFNYQIRTWIESIQRSQ